MLVLVLGIVVFLGVHSLTTFRETRTHLIERFGASFGIFSSFVQQQHPLSPTRPRQWPMAGRVEEGKPPYCPI
jgi:hypothetical protein